MSDSPGWQTAGVNRGTFGAFEVHGIRYLGKAGEVAWHTTSRPLVGSREHRRYWVTGGRFEVWGGFHIGGPMNTITTGPLAENVDPSERVAVLEAIAAWTEPND